MTSPTRGVATDGQLRQLFGLPHLYDVIYDASPFTILFNSVRRKIKTRRSEVSEYSLLYSTVWTKAVRTIIIKL